MFFYHSKRSNSWPVPVPIVTCLLALGILLAGCSDSTSPPSGDNGNGDPFTGEALFVESAAAIDAAADAATLALTTGSIAEAMTAAAASLQADPHVTTATVFTPQVGDPCLVAQFTNGIVFTMPVLRLGTDLKDAAKSPAAQDQEPIPASVKNLTLPGNRNAAFFDNPEFTTSVSLLSNLARTQGFNSNYRTSFTVDDCRSLGNHGLVYISSHGSLFKHLGQDYYEIMTTQKRDPTTELKMLTANELQSLQVTLGRGLYVLGLENPYLPDDSNYFVTNLFFEKQVGSFPDNSLVFIDCCESYLAGSSESLPPLVASLSGGNVQAFLGWTGVVDNGYSSRATNYMIACGIGYLASGLNYVPTKTPPLRPFSVQDCYLSLQTLGWHVDPIHPGTTLQLHDYSKGTKELALVPSIGQLIVEVDVEDNTQWLKLLGDFGGRRGKVKVLTEPYIEDNATELTVETWSDDEIVCRMPGDEHGYVVASLDGRISNAHPLSKWSGPFEISGTSPSGIGPTVQVTMNAVWRDEIIAERPMPEMEPFPEYGWSGTLFGLDADCDYVFSGTFEDSRYIYEYRPEMNTGTQPVGLQGEEMFFGTVTSKPSEATGRIQANFSRYAVAMKTDKQNPQLPPVQDTVLVSIPIYLDMVMDSVGKIESGEDLTVFQISWQEIVPLSPPLASTRR